MTYPRPSGGTLAAIVAALDRIIVAAAIPKGNWLTFEKYWPGYDVSQLLLVFDDNSSLNFWSETVCCGSEPWDESFVLHAVLLASTATPLENANPGAPLGFEIAPPIHAVFESQKLSDPLLFVDLLDTHVSTESNYLSSDSLRLRVGSSHVDFMTEGQSVMPLSL